MGSMCGVVAASEAHAEWAVPVFVDGPRLRGAVNRGVGTCWHGAQYDL